MSDINDKKNTPPHTIAEKDRVPIKEKIAYGCGGVASGIQETADNKLMNPVFVLGAGISPTMMSLCGLIYRLWDALLDAYMGVLSDNTRTRWGRRRPYIFVGAFLMGISMPIVFLFNPEWDIKWITVWMVGAFLFIYFAQTVFNIPYQAMLLESSQDTNERTNMAAWRSYFGQIVMLFMAWSWYIAQMDFFQIEGAKIPTLNGALWVVSVFAIVVVLLGLMPAVFMKERFYSKIQKQEQLGVWQNFKLTFKNRPFRALISYVLLFLVGFNLQWGLVFYVRYYYVCGGDEKLAAWLSGWESTLQIGMGILGIFFFRWFAQRKGKILAMKLVVICVSTAGVSTYFLYNPAIPYLSIVPGLLFSPVVSGMWVLIPSMTGDIVDDDELQNSERREGAFASVFSWVVKLALSLATAISGPLIEVAGYTAEMRHDLPEDVIWNMRMMLVFIPAGVIFCAFFCLTRYTLTTEVIWENRRKLEARRGDLAAEA